MDGTMMIAQGFAHMIHVIQFMGLMVGVGITCLLILRLIWDAA